MPGIKPILNKFKASALTTVHLPNSNIIIHLSVLGHLDFQILTIVNMVSINITAQMPIQTSEVDAMSRFFWVIRELKVF